MQEYLDLLPVIRQLIPVYGPEISATARAAAKEVEPLLTDLGEYMRKQSVKAVTDNFNDFIAAGFTRSEALELTKLFTPTLSKTLQEMSTQQKKSK